MKDMGLKIISYFKQNFRALNIRINIPQIPSCGLAVQVGAKRAPIVVQVEAKRAPIVVQVEAKRAPIVVQVEAKRAPIVVQVGAKRAPIVVQVGLSGPHRGPGRG